jgi:hypothetical protein
MSGIKMLQKVQLGKETVMGTAVAATAIWRGMGAIEDQHEQTFVEETIGIIGGADRAYSAKKLAKISLDNIEATFEQIAYLFEMGIKAVATGAADGVGTSKIYAYTLPTTAVNTINTYTIEAGDNQQAEEVEYCYAENIKISGKAGEAVKVSADIYGRQVTKTTFTGALAAPTVEEILTSKGKLYIDAVSGTAGTTQISNSLLEFTINIKTGWIQKYTIDGNLYFTFIQQVGPEITVDLTFEHDASSVAQKDAWIAGTPKLLCLTFEGSAVATPGTAYTYKTLKIVLAGKWDKFDALGDQDGNDIVKGTFRARYNSTAAQMGSFTVVNELTALV